MTDESDDQLDSSICSEDLASRGSPSSGVPPASAEPDALFHGVLLLMSAGVLIAAACLQIRGTDQVVLPVVNIALPDVCSYKRLVGVDCPGCGLTRCFISLLNGDLKGAWAFNPAGVLLFVVVVVQIPYRGFQLHRLRRGYAEIRLPRLALATIWLLVISLFIQWFARDGPWFSPAVF